MTIPYEKVGLKPWKRKIFYHLLVWSVFIGYELLCIVATIGLDTRYFHYGIYYLLYIALFYFNAHVVLDLSFYRTKQPYWVASGLIVAEIAVFGAIKIGVDRLIQGGNGPWWTAEPANRAYLLSNAFRLIFFIGFSIAYWSMLNLTRFRDEARRLEIERLKQHARNLELENEYISIENAYLQNQVSPHILFNSLNFIYYSVYQLSERAGKGIMLLSELLRYSLSAGTTKDKLVGLETEIKQIRNLIELDRMRFKGQRYLSVIEKNVGNNLLVLPLALLTLVENMIKHGECGDQEHPAFAELDVTDNLISFKTVNKKRSTVHPSTGIGLQNLRKRLNNTYPGKHDFTVRQDDDEFIADLKVYL